MIYHQDLAAGRWRSLSFIEQMANIASEVERALNWKLKNQPVYFQKASERALELMDLTLDQASSFSKRRELARAREVMTDYWFGDNQFSSMDQTLRKYFAAFSFAARKNH